MRRMPLTSPRHGNTQLLQIIRTQTDKTEYRVVQHTTKSFIRMTTLVISRSSMSNAWMLTWLSTRIRTLLLLHPITIITRLIAMLLIYILLQNNFLPKISSVQIKKDLPILSRIRIFFIKTLNIRPTESLGYQIQRSVIIWNMCFWSWFVAGSTCLH